MLPKRVVSLLQAGRTTRYPAITETPALDFMWYNKSCVTGYVKIQMVHLSTYLLHFISDRNCSLVQ